LDIIEEEKEEQKEPDKRAKDKDKNKGKLSFSPRSLRIKNTDDFLVLFFRQLSEMISAGMPVYYALTVITNQFNDKKIKLLIDGLRYYLAGKGEALYKAMSEFPRIFPSLWVVTVKAAEEGGFLVAGLKKIAEEAEKDRNFKRKFYSVLTYPIFIVAASIAAMIAMLKFVLPSIMPFSKAMNVDMPAGTKILMAIFAVVNSPITLLIIFLIAFLFYKIVKTSRGAEVFENILLELPIVNKVLKYKAVVRFSRTYSLMCDSGMSGTQILQILGTSLDSPHHERIFKHIKEEVENGELLSDCIEKRNMFPRIVVSMIRIGEETGDMKTLLKKLSYFYESEIESTMNTFFTLLEPVLLIFMGIMVGFIVLSMFLPVYEMISK